MKTLTKDDFIESSDLTKSDHWKIDKQLVEQIIVNQEDAILCQQLIKILVQHCGETGENEGAVETLNRIIKDAEAYNNLQLPDKDTMRDYWNRKEIVERLRKRIEDIKKLLENPNLTKEESMELQYWLRENTMALGE